MAGSPQEIPVTPTIQNTETIVRLQKVFSFAEGGTIQLHGAKIELRGGVNIDTMKKRTPIETKGKGEKRETNLVDFLQEDTSIQTFLEKAIEEDVLSADQLRAVKLPIASVTTGTEVAQKLDLSKPLTNIQKTEAIGLILQNIGQGNLVEEIAAEMNQKLKRTGKFASTPFTQMDYLNALTAVGGQTLLNAIREGDYRPYQITGEDSTRRKVSSLVTPTYESEDYRRELSEVTKGKGKDEGMDVFMESELQESASVDVKAAQTMFNLFLPPSELLAMNKLELQIGRETDFGKKESLRHELVKKRQMGYIALLQANGVKGYEANGPIVKELIGKGVLTAEEVNLIQGKMVGRIEKIMTKKGIHELSLHDANIDSLVQITSENYIIRKKTGTVQKAVRDAFDSIEINRDAITKLEQELGEKGFSKSQRTRKAYEQLWKQFNGALTKEGLTLKKSETLQDTADTEEALKLFFFDRVRTELGMTERKIKFESGYKNPSDVRLSEVEDWGIKGLDLLYRRTQSTQVYKDVGDYDEKIRVLLQKMALGEEQREEKKPTALVQETPKKLDEKTEALRKTLEANLPNTPPAENLTVEQAVRLSQVLEQVISAQLQISQEPSSTLLDAVGSLVTAKKPEFHQSADLLLRLVLGEAVRTPAGRAVIDTLLPQILERLKDQPQRLDEITDIIDGQQQNEEIPDAVADKLGALVEKYAPTEEPKPLNSAADLSWLTRETVTTSSDVAEPKKKVETPPPPPPPKARSLETINAQIEEVELSQSTVSASQLTGAERLRRGFKIGELYQEKKAEVATTLEPHLAALGISNDRVSSRFVTEEGADGKRKRILIFEVTDPVTVPFSDETSKQLEVLNEAATAAQGVEVHIKQLNLTPVEKVGEKPVGLQLPADVGTLVAKDGAEGIIGVNNVGTVRLEGTAKIELTRGGAGRSSIRTIEAETESDLVIGQGLVKDLKGQTIWLALPLAKEQFLGYVGAGDYIMETAVDGKVITVKPLPSGGGIQPTPPPPPPATSPPPTTPTPPVVTEVKAEALVTAPPRPETVEQTVRNSLRPELATLFRMDADVHKTAIDGKVKVTTETRPGPAGEQRVTIVTVDSFDFDLNAGSNNRALSYANALDLFCKKAASLPGVEVHVAQAILVTTDRTSHPFLHTKGVIFEDLTVKGESRGIEIFDLSGKRVKIEGKADVALVNLETAPDSIVVQTGAYLRCDSTSLYELSSKHSTLILEDNSVVQYLDALIPTQKNLEGYSGEGEYLVVEVPGDFKLQKIVRGGAQPRPPPLASPSPPPQSSAPPPPPPAATSTPPPLHRPTIVRATAQTSAAQSTLTTPPPPNPDDFYPLPPVVDDDWRPARGEHDWMSDLAPTPPPTPSAPSQQATAEVNVNAPPRAEAPRDVSSDENLSIKDHRHLWINNGIIAFGKTSQGSVLVNRNEVRTLDHSSPFIESNEMDIFVRDSSSPTIGENKSYVSVNNGASLYLSGKSDSSSININDQDALLFVSTNDKKGRIGFIDGASESQVFAVGGLPSVDSLPSHSGYVMKDGRKFVVIAAKNAEGQTAYAVFESRKTGEQETLNFVDGRRDDKEAKQAILLGRLEEKTGLDFTADEIEKATVTLIPPEPPTEPQPGFRARFKKFINDRVEKPPKLLTDEQVLVSNLEFEPTNKVYLQTIIDRLNLEGPENNQMKDALAKELNRMIERKHKEKELPAFVEMLADQGEMAHNLLLAVIDYSNKYEDQTRLALLIQHATSLDAFVLHYPGLNRFISTLNEVLDFRDITDLVRNLHGPSQLENELYSDIIRNNSSEHIPNPAETFGALMNLTGHYNELQDVTIINIHNVLIGLDEAIIDNTLNFLNQEGVADAIRSYRKRYNQASRKGLNRNPFSKQFPQLEQFLKEEEKSAKESRTSEAGTRPEE